MDDEFGLTKPYFIKTTEIPPKKLSSPQSTKPTRQATTGEKVKRALFIGLAAGGAFTLSSMPIAVSASFLSDLFQKTTTLSLAPDSTFNSQTLPLLTPAKNIDPNPSVGGGDITLVQGEALLPDNSASPGSDVVSRPVQSQISIYLVREGDSLSSIATMFNVTTNTIVGANNIKKGHIVPGQELIILPIAGVQHVVLKNETLAGLAKKFGSDAAEIAQYNNLSLSDDLTVGQNIIIPNGVLPEPVAPKPKVAVKPKTTAKTLKANPLRGETGGPDYGGYYRWPVGGGILTQGLHGFNGIDIGAPSGSEIYAAAAGTVLIAKNNGAWNGGYGNYVVIEHANGTQSLYAHASKVLASPGATVERGELIAKVGRTGQATGFHLHFEVRGATNPFGATALGSRE